MNHMVEPKHHPAPPARTASTDAGSSSRGVRRFFSDLGHQLRSVRIRERFTRDNFISFLKTFVWVAPLTILIWIWAEREQLDTLSGQTVPIEVRIPGTNKVGTIITPRERNVVLSLRGPRAQLDAIRTQLSQRAIEQRVALDLDPQLDPSDKDYNFSAQALLQRSDFFEPYGVTITDVSPAQLAVVISELQTLDVPVRNPPAEQFPNIGPETSYEPSVVRVTGKKQDLLDPASLYVYPNLTGRDLSKPGTYDLKSIPLLPSPSLESKQVTLSPTNVNAALVVREANIAYTLNSMPVFLSHPADMLNKYQVDYDPFLERVTLIGRRETIDAIASGKLAGAAPKARLEITNADAPPNAQPRTKVVQYDLPEGVTVSPADKAKQIRFTVRERSGD